MDNEKYLPELMAEKDTLDPTFHHSLRLLDQEIEKLQKDEEKEEKEEEKFIDVVINKNMKLGQKVLIPFKQFPKFNFVGKLLGPRGNSLKRLQEDTLTKMSILGKGSMRDKEKEEELRKSGEAKYQHLNEDLHVLIEVFAPPAEAYNRMGHALEEIKKFLIPDYNDEIRQAQLQELTYLNGGSEDAKVPAVRGKLPAARGRGTPAPGPIRNMMMDTGQLTMTRVMTPTTTVTAIKDRTQTIIMSTDTIMVRNHTSHMVRRSGQLIAARCQLHGRPRECTERRPTPDIELIMQQPAQSLTDVSSSNGFYTDAPFLE
ncbi:KH domain-containing, RNA-binding, signal transduction-associated protein 3-like isoform X4 [Oncorhynchus mykiss]|uniref:KH domain-containing, RNA-binding, signal transduction-associated protein 3-like isoform X4 n=1 Tax=Oncorhynchus mykiss TaxID=8022 RepID=UPI0018785048|nr:KH domain-containing, RNA-binding, signal transduction-associated protein 3-like isoform X4 [Oncorhynchus mykiss]